MKVSKTEEAITLRIISVILLTIMGGFVFKVSKQLHVFEISFWRSLFSFAPLVMYIVATRQSLRVNSKYYKPLLWIGVLGFATMFLNFTAISSLSNSAATAISYLSPIFSYIAGVFFLKERHSQAIIICILLGFLGVVLFLEPGFSSQGAFRNPFLGVLCGLSFALVTSAIRAKSKALTLNTPAIVIPLVFSSVGVLLSFLSLKMAGEPLQAVQISSLLAIGFLGGLSQIASIEALKRAPVSRLAPFEYLGLPLALIIDVIFLVPGILVQEIVGAVFIGLAALASAFVIRSQVAADIKHDISKKVRT